MHVPGATLAETLLWPFSGWRQRRRLVDQAALDMLSLYRSNLDVRLQCIDQASLQSDCQREVHANIAGILRAPRVSIAGADYSREWDEVHKAERLMALLYAGQQLRQEISVRLQDLVDDKVAGAAGLRRDYEVLLLPQGDATPVPDDSLLRAFLLRVLEARHWHDKRKYLARPIRKTATKIILCGVIISLAALLVPYGVLNYSAGESIGPWWSLFALYTALTSGLMGAFFSRLTTIHRDWANMGLEDVFLHREMSYTLLRAGVGVCGALIVYFFLRSEMVTGTLFPNFDKIAIEFVHVPAENTVGMTFVMPSDSLALLTVWCFLAGFSEKFVPNILATTEQQFANASAPAQNGRR
jgi:hypothetical protein